MAGIREWEQKTPLKFNVLRDEGNTIGEAFGVVYTFPDDLRKFYETAFAKNISEINDAEGWNRQFLHALCLIPKAQFGMPRRT